VLTSVFVTLIGATHALAQQRTLVHETIIAAPVEKVWDAFTEPEEAAKWMAPKATIDWRIGGEYRTSYDPNSTLDDDTTIVNRILAFEPQRMLTMQNVRAPQGLPQAELFQHTWSVIYFESLGPQLTRIRSVGLGYGEGPDWDEIYNLFESHNAVAYDKLKTSLETSPRATAESVLALLQRATGGYWIHESSEPPPSQSSDSASSVFRVRNQFEPGPDGQSIVTRSALGDGQGLQPHGSAIIYREPQTGRVMFLNVDENGATSRGEVRLVGDNTVHWDWNLQTLDGRSQRYDVTTEFRGPDEYVFRLGLVQADGSVEMLRDLTFRRVIELPAEFR
jgi:uncharacterized protein YndB with AHSA1/START domain